MLSDESAINCDIPDNIYSNKIVNGTCTVDYKGARYNPVSCKMMQVRVKPKTPNSDTCLVNDLPGEKWAGRGCKVDFIILCSKENVSIDLQCIESTNNFIMKINGKC